MVKHIIIWDFNDSLSADEKKICAGKIKSGLESLNGVIDGLINITVYTELLGTSNGDIMLDSEFESAGALDAYAVHPEHLKVKDYISSVVKSRKCADIII